MQDAVHQFAGALVVFGVFLAGGFNKVEVHGDVVAGVANRGHPGFCTIPKRCRYIGAVPSPVVAPARLGAWGSKNDCPCKCPCNPDQDHLAEQS